MYLPISTDIDECSAEPNPCDENADCTNSDGSYSCACKQGFAGDGTTCEGTQVDYKIIPLSLGKVTEIYHNSLIY